MIIKESEMIPNAMASTTIIPVIKRIVPIQNKIIDFLLLMGRDGFAKK